ncbi:MAG: class I fructose-bisphosphate aldolase [Trueperaceae bacterium]|nr:class I fructose-bisphosphate aldolase [Trueperaceae bacterium]
MNAIEVLLASGAPCCTLLPIVEPEVLMDGDHDIDCCFDATEATLREALYQLAQQGVDLEGVILKPNMVLSGSEASDRLGPETVAEMTLTCFSHTVPDAVPGIAFLSGGGGLETSVHTVVPIGWVAAWQAIARADANVDTPFARKARSSFVAG